MPKIVTIKTLAEKVGLSNETVSHILSGKARKYHHSKETEQKVLNTAKKMGYRPNAMAKAARNGRFGQIGFIYCSGKAYLPDSLMQGIQEEIVRRGLNLVLSWIPEDMLLKEDSFPDKYITTVRRNIPRNVVPLCCDQVLRIV